MEWGVAILFLLFASIGLLRNRRSHQETRYFAALKGVGMPGSMAVSRASEITGIPGTMLITEATKLLEDDPERYRGNVARWLQTNHGG